MRYWWLFMRYATAVDLYMAQASGNKDATSYYTNQLAEIDRRLDTMAINGGRS